MSLLGVVDVPGPPVPKARARTVRDKDGTPHTFTPRRTKAYEELVGWSYQGQRRYEGTVRLVVIVHEGRGHPADADNLIKSALDGLNGVAYVDDKQVLRIEAEVFRDSPNPSLYVEVWEYNQKPIRGTYEPNLGDLVLREYH